MNKFKQQSRPFTSLHDFAKNNRINQKDKQQTSNLTNKRSEQSKFGLSTLLHFNNNSTISSIRSKIQYSRVTLQSPQFTNEAKLEIEELKLKRLELEKKWGNKPIKHSSEISNIQQIHNNDQLQCIQSCLDESQVQDYFSSLSKTKYEKENCLVQDRFILDLKNQIKADKAKQFIQKIKRVAIKSFITTLQKYGEVKQFRQKCRINMLKKIIQEWKQISDRAVQRQHLRRLVVEKIKKRKILRELSEQSNFDNFIL